MFNFFRLIDEIDFERIVFCTAKISHGSLVMMSEDLKRLKQTVASNSSEKYSSLERNFYLWPWKDEV